MGNNNSCLFCTQQSQSPQNQGNLDLEPSSSHRNVNPRADPQQDREDSKEHELQQHGPVAGQNINRSESGVIPPLIRLNSQSNSNEEQNNGGEVEARALDDNFVMNTKPLLDFMSQNHNPSHLELLKILTPVILSRQIPEVTHAGLRTALTNFFRRAALQIQENTSLPALEVSEDVARQAISLLELLSNQYPQSLNISERSIPEERINLAENAQGLENPRAPIDQPNARRVIFPIEIDLREHDRPADVEDPSVLVRDFNPRALNNRASKTQRRRKPKPESPPVDAHGWRKVILFLFTLGVLAFLNAIVAIGTLKCDLSGVSGLAKADQDNICGQHKFHLITSVALLIAQFFSSNTYGVYSFNEILRIFCCERVRNYTRAKARIWTIVSVINAVVLAVCIGSYNWSKHEIAEIAHTSELQQSIMEELSLSNSVFYCSVASNVLTMILNLILYNDVTSHIGKWLSSLGLCLNQSMIRCAPYLARLRNAFPAIRCFTY